MLGEMGTELSLANLKRMPMVLSSTSQVTGSSPVTLSTNPDPTGAALQPFPSALTSDALPLGRQNHLPA